MEKIKIDQPNLLYRFLDEKDKNIKDLELNKIFEEIVKIISEKLKKEVIEPSFQNIFTKENILKMETFLKQKFPGKEIDLSNLIEGGMRMSELDDIIFKLVDARLPEAVEKAIKPLKDEIEMLRNKKTIPVQLFLDIKKSNPDLSDEEALKLAKQQIDNLGELS